MEIPELLRSSRILRRFQKEENCTFVIKTPVKNLAKCIIFVFKNHYEAEDLSDGGFNFYLISFHFIYFFKFFTRS